MNEAVSIAKAVLSVGSISSKLRMSAEIGISGAGVELLEAVSAGNASAGSGGSLPPSVAVPKGAAVSEPTSASLLVLLHSRPAMTSRPLDPSPERLRLLGKPSLLLSQECSLRRDASP